MGRYIIKESVASDDRLREQRLKELDLFGQFGKTQELDGVHFRETIGDRGAGWCSRGVRVRV
jgi:hypothetical protein